MAEQTGRETGHNTVWRCDGEACRMVADIYDAEAAVHYGKLLNVMAAGAEPEVRFEVVQNAGFWKGCQALGTSAS